MLGAFTRTLGINTSGRDEVEHWTEQSEGSAMPDTFTRKLGISTSGRDEI